MELKDIERVVIIGSGNLAEALARAIAAAGFCVAGIVARNKERGQAVAQVVSAKWFSTADEAPAADLYLISVSDRSVGEVADKLHVPAGAIVAHTAGCVALDALAAHPLRAVFYPLMTFTKGRAVDFSDIPIFLECSTGNVDRVMGQFAEKISATVDHADSARRRKIHLAGVFANNFANHMFVLAEEVMGDAGLGFEVLKPIIRETAAKACDAGSPRDVQTGPAVRGDRASMNRHMELLENKLLTEDIYTKISQSIWETSKKI